MDPEYINSVLEVTTSDSEAGQGSMLSMTTEAEAASTQQYMGTIDTGISAPTHVGVEVSQPIPQPPWTQQQADAVRESIDIIETHEPLLQLVEQGGEILQAEVTVPAIRDMLRTQIMQRLLLLHRLDSLYGSENQVLDLSNHVNMGQMVDMGAFSSQVASSVTPQSHQPTRKEKVHCGFTCDQCGKVLSSKWALTCHKRIHLDVKPYACSLCPYRGTQKTHLIQHFRSHTNEKPYKCNICDNAYMSSTSLNHHIRYKHTGKKSMPCNHCGIAFDSLLELKSHRKMCRQNSRPYSTIHKDYIPSWVNTNH